MKPVSLSGECSIYEISSLHQKIMENWKGDDALKLNLSKVTDIDSSFIQLLMSCKKTAEKQQQTFELLNTSEMLTEKIDSMLTAEFFSAQPTQDIDEGETKSDRVTE